jgi:hypothetical protein
MLTKAEIQTIRLPEAELRSYAFVTQEEAYGRFNERLGRRVRQSLAALAGGRTMYLEDQQELTGEL